VKLEQPSWFDRDGQPMTFEAWIEAYHPQNFTRCRRIAQDTTPGGHIVSTVWLGLDHSFGEGPPLIFETMVQLVSGDWVDQQRYSTEAEARSGHAEVLARWLDVDALCVEEGEP
jgi:hypothetical protein